MNKRLVFVSFMGVVLCWRSAFSDDSFVNQLLPPEFIVQHRAEINLTDEQLQRIRDHAQSGGRQAEERLDAVRQAHQKMEAIFSKEKIDEAKALRQLDKFLDVERDIKKLHLSVMIRVRNELTSTQIRTLLKKKRSGGDADPSGLEGRLKGKLSRIRQEVDRRVKSGVPPMEAARIMNGFQKAMEAGNPREAEAILDRVLKMLELEDASESDRRGKGDTTLNETPKEISKLERSALLSLDELKQSVDALKREDVAWRKIKWETCLLSGLQRSRNEQKPLILWVFIDRPTDDERC